MVKHTLKQRKHRELRTILKICSAIMYKSQLCHCYEQTLLAEFVIENEFAKLKFICLCYSCCKWIFMIIKRVITFLKHKSQ